MTNPGHRIWVLAILLVACTGVRPPTTSPEPSAPATVEATPAGTPVKAPAETGVEAAPLPLPPVSRPPWAEATLLRLSIAEALDSFIVMDDQLTQSDPQRMEAIRDLSN